MPVLIVVFALALGTAVAGHLLEPGDSSLGIIGGSDAKIGQYPHQVSIRIEGKHECGGSIISTDWILTAAKCVAGRRASTVTVVVGTISLKSGGVEHRITGSISHEGYLKDPKNDLAVVRLESPISYNEVVRPIGLTNSSTPGGVSCSLAGWGVTRRPSDGDFPNLQQIQLKSLTLDQCRSHNPSLDDDGLICTIAPSGQQACWGDPGGALLCGGVQAGILIITIDFCRGWPDVYVDVSYNREWIRNTTGV